jgi:putative Ca2+/H+ antiporter (TMEM165/GDT1 family)
MIALAVSVYLTVLLAEIVGDKTLYTVGSLATDHSPPAVLAGAGLAVVLKMGVAALLGGLISRLPPLLVSIVSTATFLAMAVAIWRRRERPPGPAPDETSPVLGARLAFLGIFLTEWGDFGQIATATLVAEYGRPAIVWAASSAAMFTKVSIAAALGAGFGRWIPRRILRPVTASLCVLMAIAAALRFEV